MASSTVRYGPGVTQEIGMDIVNFKSKNVLVITDPNIAVLPPVKTVMDSLTKNGLKFEVYDKTRVEPTEER